ncbi:MAG: sugar phosphate isomerase/epimerase [Clostridia bacterium]|nr:sugar phosphate isomerase/epimerase [Clostridia bacterium]
MFQLGIQTGGTENVLGIDKAYELIRNCGFTAADVNLDRLFPVRQVKAKQHSAAFEGTDAEILSRFEPWKKASEKYGIVNYQAHAPFPSYTSDPAYNEYMIGVLQKTIMGCASIGCRRLVIHPFYLQYDEQLDQEAEWKINMEHFARLIPAAKKYGVMILLENMIIRYRDRRYLGTCCSDAEMACRYVDALNELAGERVFGFCVDTGHLLLAGLDLKKFIVTLGHRIEAFHVHDNDGEFDHHIAPYMGILDWNRFVDALREIGYDKTLCFETFGIWNVIDHELCPAMMRFIAETGRMFASRAQNHE